MKLTNAKNITESMAVFLAHDDYDYDPRPNAISATTLLKSTRQTVLAKRVIASDMALDVSSFIASSYGTAIHNAIEAAWSNGNHIKALRRLGKSEDTIARYKINPLPEEITDRTIAVHFEKRTEKPLGKWIVVGKFDFVEDGQLEDHKSTGVYTYMKKTKNEDYRIQGSVYRWLNPDIITNDRMLVNFIFTDWSSMKADIERDKGYPPYRLMSMPVNLMSISETQHFIEAKLKDIEAHISTPEPDLPLCNQKELWQGDTVFAYYKNPDKTDKSTKNFDNFSEAQMQLMKDGSVGVIKIRKGMVKYCAWCPAASICSQCQQLIADGLFQPEGI